MTAVDVPRSTPVRRSQTRRAAWWLTSSHLFMAGWFWGIVLVLAIVSTAVVRGGGVGMRSDGTPASAMSMAAQSAVWFTFAMAIALSLRQLRPHLAAGLTRRSFVRANLLVVLGMAAVYALVMVLFLVVEALVVRAAGWEPRTVDGVLFGGVSDAPAAFVGFLLLFGVAALAGLVVAMSYHALGGRWGTVLLLPAVPPVFLVMMLVDRSSSSGIPSALDSDVVRVLLTVAIGAVYALVYRASMRRATV